MVTGDQVVPLLPEPTHLHGVQERGIDEEVCQVVLQDVSYTPWPIFPGIVPCLLSTLPLASLVYLAFLSLFQASTLF